MSVFLKKKGVSFQAGTLGNKTFVSVYFEDIDMFLYGGADKTTR